jgi:hypothetical protein
MLKGGPPIFLGRGAQVLLTLATAGGIGGLLADLLYIRNRTGVSISTNAVSWRHLGWLLGPFTMTYVLLLVPRSTDRLYDRYLLPLLAVVVLCLTRYYQERIDPRLPLAAGSLIVLVMAIYGISTTHNLFSLYRARVALAAELNASGIPDTSVDNSWEYNLNVELKNSPSINYPTITVPTHFYTPAPHPTGICTMYFYDYTPHIHPLYGISFDPNACYGPAPITPVTYSRWLASGPGTLYVVRYVAPTP